jgi:choline dehydrogenase-like flavoprotein
MFVVVARKGKVVRVSGLTVNEACWLGYKFARDCPVLVAEGWIVVAFDAVATHYSRAETYNVPGDWFQSARELKKILKNPPSIPIHACPDCKCKIECCKGE